MRTKSKILSITSSFTFDAAHFLPNYSGKCKNLHGHTYKLEVTVCGETKFGHGDLEVGESGMVMDFSALKDLMKSLLNSYDHALLNDLVPNPTAENLVLKLWEVIEGRLNFLYDEHIHLKRLKLWETPTNCVELKGV